MISLFAIEQEPNKKLIYHVAKKTTIAIQSIIVLAGDLKSPHNSGVFVTS